MIDNGSPFTCIDHTDLAQGTTRQEQADQLREWGYQPRRCGACGSWAVWVDRRRRPVRSYAEALAEQEPDLFDGDPDEALGMVAAWVGSRLTLADDWHAGGFPAPALRQVAERQLAESEAWLLKRGLLRRVP